MKHPWTTKLIWFAAAGVLVGFILWWKLPALLQINEDPRSERHLGRVAAELNRSVPTMIDAETELMPAQSAEGILIYNYRLVNYSAARIDKERFAAGAKQNLRERACNTAETRDEFLKQGVTLRYSYYDKDKQLIATIDVTPRDCGF